MTEVEDIKKLKIVKYKTLDSLLFFTRYFFKIRYNRKFIVSEHHELICNALERVLRGETTRLIINLPPRFGKTELAVKNFIAHGLALNKSAKFIHLTYADNLALDNSEDTKDLVQEPDYQKLFDVKIKADSKSKKKWYTDSGGGVYATSAGGQVTGFGAGKVDEQEDEDSDVDLIGEIDQLSEYVESFLTGVEQKMLFAGAIIIDDANKPEDASSDIKRERVNNRFETTIRNRVNSRRTPIVVIQQRTHERDLSGYLMDVEPGEWEILTLPALKPDGSSLWPLKHTSEDLLKLKRINPYVFESQYQQNPKPIRKGGEAYKLFDASKNTVPNIVINKIPELYNPDLPIGLSFDFNVRPYMTCTLHQLKGKKDVQIDEITLPSPNNRTEAVCEEFKRRYPLSIHDKGIYIYGDPSGRQEDTRTEQGFNDYKIIMRCLEIYRPELRVFAAHPPVAMRIRFINSIFDTKFNDCEIEIGQNCVKTIDDYQFLKENSEGTKLKEKVRGEDGVSYEKHGHCTDANDYYYLWIFSDDFKEFQTGGMILGPVIGGVRGGGRRF